MTTLLFVIGTLVGTVALIVLAALLHGAAFYLNSCWRNLTSNKSSNKRSVAQPIRKTPRASPQ